MFLLFLGLFVVGMAGYAGFTGLWPRFIFAHIGGLGILGLLACWAGAIAKKKGRSYWGAFSFALMTSVMLGIISVGLVRTLGGHGCGGIVSIVVALAVIIFHGLAKKSPAKPKATGPVSSVGGNGL